MSLGEGAYSLGITNVDVLRSLNKLYFILKLTLILVIRSFGEFSECVYEKNVGFFFA